MPKFRRVGLLVLGVLCCNGVLLAIPGVTFAQSVRVPISFHRQEHSLSCEIASLKTALASHGIVVAEQELISRLPFDRTAKTEGVWGDPQRGFVGDIDGRMLITGYGVYADPIAQVGGYYARTALIRGGSPAALARAVARGNPVIIWGHYGSGAPYSWRTPAGKTIQAVDGEHTRVVYGFDGSVSAPTRFYLMDPLGGSRVWPTQELVENWDDLGAMGVVVAPRWVRVPGDAKVWEISTDAATRHWVVGWDTFVSRGGSSAAIVPIAKTELAQYKQGEEIR